MANDWKLINDTEELKVMHKYTEAGRQSVMLYSGIDSHSLKLILTRYLLFHRIFSTNYHTTNTNNNKKTECSILFFFPQHS